ncbi:succinyl-diaminopimelate desuccinylase [Haloferula helveola]|uniref:Succinyl-diaminopimelate desuccinylase n=1 Tax=Haloferula helveola TaxID=490095 RepID=A0ABN6H227_9BACT|nr:succinyl-diaminopimelate desuccinylase [Haloferula helveola]
MDSDLTDRLVALSRDLILIPSTDSQPQERARAFSFFRNHLEPLDHIRIERHESGNYESLVVLPADVQHAEILMIGHLDVIEHPDLDLYRSHIKDGRLYGPGAGDMKGALAIMLKLFCDLHRAQPGIPLGMVITSDEERGGEHGVGYLVREAGLRAKHAIVPDGGSIHNVTVEEKGIAHLRVHTVGKAAHAARPWLSDNAATRLATALARLPAAFPIPTNLEGEHWQPTCSLTTLHTPNRTLNCIPDRADATLDLRFPPPHRLADILDRLQDILGPEVTLETVVAAEPSQLNPDPLWFDITEEITGEPVREVRASGGSDARFLCQAGVQTIVARPEVGNLHAADEWIDIRSMATFYEIARYYILRSLA